MLYHAQVHHMLDRSHHTILITVDSSAAHRLQLICTRVITTLRSISLPFDSVNRSSALYALQCAQLNVSA